MGVVHATAKQLLQKEPLCWVLQAVGFHASRLGVALATFHVACGWNMWAESLSRGGLTGFNFNLQYSVDVFALLEDLWLDCKSPP